MGWRVGGGGGGGWCGGGGGGGGGGGVIEVNVNVVDIKSKEEYEEDSETVQDKVTGAAKSTGEFASEQTEKAKKAVNKGTEQVKENMEPRVE